MRIAIGSDHAGFHYKARIIDILVRWGYEVQDFGTYSDESVDYPKFIRPVALAVAAGDFERGIVLGGSGNGEAIVANRVPGIRCTLCWNVESARYARLHNRSSSRYSRCGWRRRSRVGGTSGGSSRSTRCEWTGQRATRICR